MRPRQEILEDIAEQARLVIGHLCPEHIGSEATIVRLVRELDQSDKISASELLAWLDHCDLQTRHGDHSASVAYRTCAEKVREMQKANSETD